MKAGQHGQSSARPVRFLDLAATGEDIGDAVDAVWAQVTSTSGFVGGPLVERFEAEWAAYCGTQHCVGVGNGTDALQLILEGLGIGADDEVIVPANTFFATCEAIVAVGARPRFVDVDPETLLITADGISGAVNARTAAVIAVHLYGQLPDMDAVVALAERAGIALIEDAAQAHGATWRGRRAGSFGVAAGFSFYPGKNLGAFGDAGAVVTNDQALTARIRSLANHGRAPHAASVHDLVGINSRLDALQAGVLSAKLPHLDGWNAARRSAAECYHERFAGSGVHTVTVRPDAVTSSHLAVVSVPGRDRVRAALADQGIESGVHYPIPCHLQAPLRSICDEPLPVTESAAERILSLPMHPHLTEDQLERTSDAVLEAVADERSL